MNEKLFQTGMSISELSNELGYSDVSDFYKRLKKLNIKIGNVLIPPGKILENKTCSTCGSNFVAKSPIVRNCSPVCRKKYRLKMIYGHKHGLRAEKDRKRIEITKKLNDEIMKMYKMDMTLLEIGENVGLSKQRIHQIIKSEQAKINK